MLHDIESILVVCKTNYKTSSHTHSMDSLKWHGECIGCASNAMNTFVRACMCTTTYHFKSILNGVRTCGMCVCVWICIPKVAIIWEIPCATQSTIRKLVEWIIFDMFILHWFLCFYISISRSRNNKYNIKRLIAILRRNFKRNSWILCHVGFLWNLNIRHVFRQKIQSFTSHAFLDMNRDSNGTNLCGIRSTLLHAYLCVYASVSSFIITLM